MQTVNMWNEEGQKAIINAGDKATETKFREAGYELEEVIRKDLPEGCEDMAMEEIIAQMKEGKIAPPSKPPETEPGDTGGRGESLLEEGKSTSPSKQAETKAADTGNEGASPADMSAEGREALDQASGQSEPSPEEARESEQKTDVKKGGKDRKK